MPQLKALMAADRLAGRVQDRSKNSSGSSDSLDSLTTKESTHEN